MKIFFIYFITLVAFHSFAAQTEKICPALIEKTQDPSFIAQVAKENSLSSIRFYSMETPTQIEMITAYGKKYGICPTQPLCRSLIENSKDPAFISKVAAHNGLSTIRFYAMGTPNQREMIVAYSEKHNLCKHH